MSVGVCGGGVFFSQPVHSRQVVEVLDASSRPDGDPVDLVVQPVQKEAQELLGILLAAGGTRQANVSGLQRWEAAKCNFF